MAPLAQDLRRNAAHLGGLARQARRVRGAADLFQLARQAGQVLLDDWAPDLRLGAAERAYAGASRDDQTSGWFTPSTSANAELASAGPWLRNRSRSLVRDNPHASRAMWDLVLATVGAGIYPLPKVKTGDTPADKKRDRKANREIRQRFAAWSKVCYGPNDLDFVGVEHLVLRCCLESGATFTRGRPRLLSDGLPVPLKLQVLEPEFLDRTKNQSIDGGYILGGKQFNLLDDCTAYHLFNRHPGDPTFAFLSGGIESSPVPASSVSHLFFELRPGQVDGAPFLASVLRSLRDYDDLNDAELNRRILEACHVATVEGGDPSSAEDGNDGVASVAPPYVHPKKPGDAGRVLDGKGNPIERFKPGHISYAQPGKVIKWHAPASVSGVAEFAATVLRRIATGIGMPYSRLTDDYSQENFSSARIGNIPYKALTQTLREQFLIPLFLDKVWRWWYDAARLAGIFQESVYGSDGIIPVKWSTPRFEEADRLMTSKADLMDNRAGYQSWSDTVASRGEDPEDVLEELAADAKAFDEHELILDCDPRKTSINGIYQSTDATASDGSGTPSKKKNEAT